ncbi:MAG: hypothetical protein Q9190_002247 [Brigantiaea leucoxantha]
MQIASILSDLNSLRVCDHSAAIALVSARPPSSAKSPEPSTNSSKADSGNDPDMQRAIDLVELHYGLKVKHMNGEDQGLTLARRNVDFIINKLETT